MKIQAQNDAARLRRLYLHYDHLGESSDGPIADKCLMVSRWLRYAIQYLEEIDRLQTELTLKGHE